MSGLPTFLIELDDGTETFPFDITRYVDLTEGYSITRGRTDRFDSVQPSTLSMTLDNTDGRFAPGSTQYGIFAEQMIRVTETVRTTTSTRFTGYVTEWPVEWPNGMTKMSVVRITAVDRLARLARREFRSMIEEEIMRDDCLAYFPLGESSDVLAAGDATGNNNPLAVTQAHPGDVAFGSSKPDFGGSFLSRNELTQVAFLTQGNNAPGGYLHGTIAGVRGGNLRLEFLVSTYNLAPQQFIELTLGSSTLVIYTTLNTSGVAFLNVERLSGGTSQSLITTTAFGSLADHSVIVTETGGVRTVYVDGTNRGSDSDVCPTGPFTASLNVGLTAWAGLTQMAHIVVATYTSLTLSTIAKHDSVMTDGFSNDLATTRVHRYLDYAGVPTASRALEVTVQRVPYFPIVGQTALAAIEAMTAAERGIVFIDGDGDVVLQNRNRRNINATGTPAVTVTSDQIDGDATLILDMQQVRNYVTVNRLGGTVQTVKDDTSIARHDRYPDDYSDVALMTDAEAKAHAANLVAKYAEPLPRIPNVGLDVLALPDPTQQAILRGLEISAYVRLSNLPSQARLPNVGLIVEGWTETVSTNEWRLVVNTSSASIEL